MDDSLFFEGLLKLMVQISAQTKENMSKIVETMNAKKEISSMEVKRAHVPEPAKFSKFD